MPNIGARIIARGEVQGVGFREKVKRIAFELRVKGYVKNLEEGNVEIVGEGKKDGIEEFIERIQIKKYPIFVEEIETKFESFTGKFKSFKVIRDPDIQKEMYSALVRGTVAVEEINEKQGSMLQKQDSMTQELHEFRVETKEGFRDLGDKYHVISEELKSIDKNIVRLHEGMAKVHSDIAKSQEVLTKLVEYIGVLIKEHIGKGKKSRK